MRYGGQINENAHYRVWAKYANRDHFEDAAGNDRPDDWDLGSRRIPFGHRRLRQYNDHAR